MANPNAELKTTSKSLDDQKDNLNQDVVMQIQQFVSTLGNNSSNKNANGSNLNSSNNDLNQIRFDRQLLDFDYGDDDDDKGETPTESEPPLSTTMTNSEDLNANPLALSMAQNLLSNPDLVQKLQQSIAMQSDSGNKMRLIDNNNLDIAGSSFFNSLGNCNNLNNDLTEQLFNLRDSLKLAHQNDKYSQINKRDNYDKQDLCKRRSISPFSKNKHNSTSSKQHSSNSSRRDERNSYRTNDKRRSDRRNSRERRHRSRSPRVTSSSSSKKDPQINVYQQILPAAPSPESKEKERERERRKKGLPCVKKNYVTICSTTLWLGHLPKSTTEIDISDAFGEYGTINTIDLISARGCAYVCMNRRQDAYKALQNLKNLKLHNSHIKMAWAPGLGMKGKEFKDYWDVELGVSYIPYEKLSKNTDFELLEDGGMIDEESMNETLLELRNKKLKEDQQSNETPLTEQQTPTIVEQPPIPPPSTQTTTIQLPNIPSIVPIPNHPFPLHNLPPIPGVGFPPTLPNLPVGPPPPIMHPPTSGPPLINHPTPHLILPPSFLPPSNNLPTNISIKNEEIQDKLNSNSKQKPSLPMSLNKMNNNSNNSIPHWLPNAPQLQPPFLNPPNDLFEPTNLLINPQLQINQLNQPPPQLMQPMMPFDENNIQFNDQFNDQFNNSSNNFGRDNWRRKDQRVNNRSRFNNSYNNEDYNDRGGGGYNESRNKRKRNDNFNNSKNFNNTNKNNNKNNNNRNKRKEFNKNKKKLNETDQNDEGNREEESLTESKNYENSMNNCDPEINDSLVDQSIDQDVSNNQDNYDNNHNNNFNKNDTEMNSEEDNTFESPNNDQLVEQSRSTLQEETAEL